MYLFVKLKWVILSKKINMYIIKSVEANEKYYLPIVSYLVKL